MNDTVISNKRHNNTYNEKQKKQESQSIFNTAFLLRENTGKTNKLFREKNR